MLENPFKRIDMDKGTWAVICLAHPVSNMPGPVAPALATRSGFATREDAVYYARSIATNYSPVVAFLEGLDASGA